MQAQRRRRRIVLISMLELVATSQHQVQFPQQGIHHRMAVALQEQLLHRHASQTSTKVSMATAFESAPALSLDAADAMLLRVAMQMMMVMLSLGVGGGGA
mmetsp:Transcript_15637/g.33290  ORF Transcript_15637/g.33290 Transcript_15637/m.33290 type:complete len:100 (+) Transcript_15637:174-473(+)